MANSDHFKMPWPGVTQQPLPPAPTYVWVGHKCHEKETGRIVARIDQRIGDWFADVYHNGRLHENGYGYIDEASIKRAVESFLKGEML